MESYPFICLIFTFFMRERLSRVHTFSLCVKKLLLEFWHFQLVSCCLHCLLLWHFSDNSATAHFHSSVKKRVQSLEKAEKYGLRVSREIWTIYLKSKSTCLIPVWALCRGVTLPRSDGDRDAAPSHRHLLCQRGEGDLLFFCSAFLWEDVCAHTKVPFKNFFSESYIKKRKMKQPRLLSKDTY